jgi:hypothetical protein
MDSQAARFRTRYGKGRQTAMTTGTTGEAPIANSVAFTGWLPVSVLATETGTTEVKP